MDGGLIRVGEGYKAAPEMYALLERIAEEADKLEYSGMLAMIREPLLEWCELRAKINELKP
jgi:hypothetical protein